MKTIPCLLLALGSMPAAGYSQVFVSDAFTDGERVTQDLPDSLHWYATLASTVSVGSGALRITPNSTTVRVVAAQFADSPVTVGVGETLTFSLTFTPTVTASVTSPNALRLGLFNSNGVALSSDANPNVDYRGYAVFVNSLSNVAAMRERTGTGSALLTTVTPFTNLGTSFTPEGSPFKFEAGKTYTASLSVSQPTEGEWTIGLSMAGGGITPYSFSVPDLADIVTGFDTIAFGINSDMGATDFTFVSVTLAAAVVPEPATVSLVTGATVLLVGGRLRRRLFGRKEQA